MGQSESLAAEKRERATKKILDQRPWPHTSITPFSLVLHTVSQVHSPRPIGTGGTLISWMPATFKTIGNHQSVSTQTLSESPH